eukprot:XP_008670017.1 uncharacterized protein LOC103647228 isoform X1 [Zea mays]
MHLDVISAHFNVTYRMGPLQTFTLSCACAASSSPIPTPTLPLSFAWHILGGAAACFFTGAAACFFDDAEAYGGLPSGRVHGRTDLRRLADLRRAAYRLWTDLRCLVPWQTRQRLLQAGGSPALLELEQAGVPVFSRRVDLHRRGGLPGGRIRSISSCSVPLLLRGLSSGRTDPRPSDSAASAALCLQRIRASAARRPELRPSRAVACSLNPHTCDWSNKFSLSEHMSLTYGAVDCVSGKVFAVLGSILLGSIFCILSD